MLTQNATAPQQRSVAPIFVHEALACARNAGIDVAALLQRARVKPDQLNHLTTDAFARVWMTLSLLMQDEFFGLGARPMRPGSTTLLGHAVRDAKTLEIALRRTLRFLRVVLDDPHGSVATRDGNCIITLHHGAGATTAFMYRAFFLIVHGFNCWVAKERIPIKAVTFPCPEPTDQNDYGDFFGVPVVFNAAQAQLVFDQKYLSRPARRSEAELKIFLRSLPEAFLRGYRDTDGLKHVIIQRCLQGPPQHWPDAATIAATLGMSRSTLHRLLRQSGQTLTQLKDEQRRNRATALLSRTDMTISEISAAVGYADEGAFYRAFHRWYQTTPSHLREKPKGAAHG